ncbi:hypothetical protein B0P06_000432 [Clostridium saccharoperbutylacetonicum]|uniref:Uncharacterized protein n=1 Tax=Clostridium saccharoperbutylacetonicum N1-4(HMT) TaxID=931276 RepID=M1MGJ6_9CLOT|nr:hypothetical protein [Clostridium saccharoperbutylacetonicum]AGF55473.1 hypothetical protein Cspa_c17030 [Clostridium saccharoperbutylacetonicum N1-4(HMT)]NRT63811.1 hypothetical protein [Clostridium saccharoperbutylacetonicum]NSB27174.1 hypothetical protein [Clostridium saccharoperbutylacetonicum]NSB40661.1 hypothetical protein [Clostridium saccharoperbutylacetonicum]
MSRKETKDIFGEMIGYFSMTSWGRIDLNKINRKIRADSIHEGINKLKEENLIDRDVYILWDEASLPAIKTEIESVINVIYDITAVSFDTWIFCPSKKYLIEFYHEHEITICLK